VQERDKWSAPRDKETDMCCSSLSVPSSCILAQENRPFGGQDSLWSLPVVSVWHRLHSVCLRARCEHVLVTDRDPLLPTTQGSLSGSGRSFLSTKGKPSRVWRDTTLPRLPARLCNRSRPGGRTALLAKAGNGVTSETPRCATVGSYAHTAFACFREQPLRRPGHGPLACDRSPLHATSG
jgi:hypothetical protein